MPTIEELFAKVSLGLEAASKLDREAGWVESYHASLVALAALKAERERDRKELGAIIGLASCLGWNGVDNSKILSEFLRQTIEEFQGDLAELTKERDEAVEWRRDQTSWANAYACKYSMHNAGKLQPAGVCSLLEKELLEARTERDAALRWKPAAIQAADALDQTRAMLRNAEADSHAAWTRIAQLEGALREARIAVATCVTDGLRDTFYRQGMRDMLARVDAALSAPAEVHAPAEPPQSAPLTPGERASRIVLLKEIIRELVRHSEELASYAGTQWAEDNDLCQESHWLNVTRNEAIAALSTPPSAEERKADLDASDPDRGYENIGATVKRNLDAGISIRETIDALRVAPEAERVGDRVDRQLEHGGN